VLLPDHLGEGRRAVLPVERQSHATRLRGREDGNGDLRRSSWRHRRCHAGARHGACGIGDLAEVDGRRPAPSSNSGSARDGSPSRSPGTVTARAPAAVARCSRSSGAAPRDALAHQRPDGVEDPGVVIVSSKQRAPASGSARHATAAGRPTARAGSPRAPSRAAPVPAAGARHRALPMRRMPSTRSSVAVARDSRTQPSPSGPKVVPGATATWCCRSRSIAQVATSPWLRSRTSTHR
jgi:hypothetical protein